MSSILESAKETFRIEAAAVARLADQLTPAFEQAVEAILASSGRVVVCGLGKSGLVGKKIAATLASTGTPSIFLHPTEGLHGDLGMLTPHDILLALSKSGETPDLLRLMTFVHRRCALRIALTAAPNSTLARQADLVLDASVEREACPLHLAPTASTTAALALGDALAVALMHARGLRPEHFAAFHPGGLLGRRLLCRVEDLMQRERLPVVTPEQSLRTVIATMTEGCLGLAAVVDEAGALCGIITDGDLRRALDRYDAVLHRQAGEIMTASPKTIAPETLAAEAQRFMSAHKITALLVTPDGHTLSGVLHIHHLHAVFGRADLQPTNGT